MSHHRAASSEYSFADFEAEFGRRYEPEERAERQRLFESRLLEVLRHNGAEPKPAWRRAVNHLSDRTEDELLTLHGVDRALLYAPRGQAPVAAASAAASASLTATGSLPAAVDWRSKGVVTPRPL